MLHWLAPPLAAAAAHAHTLANGFVWDDVVFVQRWAHSQRTLVDVFFRLPDPEYSYYRPILFLSALVDRVLWGGNPFGYHLTNVVLHAACALLVAILIYRLGRDEIESVRRNAALIGGTLFAVVPWNVETVSWVFARNDLLATGFILLGLILLLGRRKIWIGPAVCFLLALLSKETGVLFIPLAALVLWVRGTDWRALPAFRTVGVLGVAALVYYGLRVMGGVGPGAVTDMFSGVDAGAAGRVFGAFGFYILSLLPVYPYHAFIESVPGGAHVAVGAIAAVAAIAEIVFFVRKRHMLVACGILWFCLAMAIPVISVLSPPSLTAVGLRHLYLPGVGVVLSFIFPLVRAVHRAPAIERWLPAASVVLLLFIPVNRSWNAPWQSDDAYWTHAVEAAPTSHVARANLSAVLYERSDFAGSAEQLRIALYECEAPSDRYRIGTALRLARVQVKLQHIAEARGVLNREITSLPVRDQFNDYTLVLALVRFAEVGPDAPEYQLDEIRGLVVAGLETRQTDPQTWFLLAALDHARDEDVLAAHAQQRGLSVTPLNQDRSAYVAKLVDYSRAFDEETDPARRAYIRAQRTRLMGKTQMAEQEFRNAMDASPKWVRPAVKLAWLLAESGRGAEAEKVLRDALARADESDHAVLWKALGGLRASLRDPDGAIEALARATALTPEDASVHRMLALAYLQTQRREEAVHHAEAFAANWYGDPRVSMRLRALFLR